jgi:hypothetical protein
MTMMRRPLIVVLLVLVLASAGLTAWLGTRDGSSVTTPNLSAEGKYRVGSLPDGEAEDAVKAAVKALPVALSYDYRSLEASLKKATALMTPAFAKEFRSTFESTTTKIATEKQAVTSSLVRAAGVVGSVKDDKATCLVYLDQVLVSSKDKKADDPLKVSQNSVHVKLRKIDGTWRVDGIEPF